MRILIHKSIIFNIITALSLQLFYTSLSVKASEAPHYASDEIIICYAKVEKPASLERLDTVVATDASPEEDFIDDLVGSYKLQAKPKTNLKLKQKQHSRFKKARQLRKHRFKKQLAIVKLDKKLNGTNLHKLVQKLNKEKFQNQDYQIEAVYPNYLYEITETTSTTPNDPYYSKQWAQTYIKPEKLWAYTKGEGVVVAVIDTGVDYTHEDLAENIWINTKEIANNGIDDDANGFVDDIRGWDFVKNTGFSCASSEDCADEDNDPSDRNGHGTHVSGIIAAVENNAKGISGIAPKAKIMPLRAGYSTGFSAYLKTSDIIDALTYAINNNADVINMSFAGAELNVLGDLLSLADKLGIVLVAAAGNSTSSAPTYPAGLPEVISVGALALDNTQASFSNYGDTVDIAAPGSWILSTTPRNLYEYKSGTSMASPCVAGVAALIKAKNKLHKVSPATVKELIISSATDTLFKRYKDTGATLGGLNAEIQFPTEVDNIIMPAKIVVGNPVTISAEITGSTSSTLHYEWTSDRDGFLSNQESFNTSNLSLGSHVISVRIEDSRGHWSEPAFKIIDVLQTKSVGLENANNLRYRIRRRQDTLYAGLPSITKPQVKSYKWISNVDGTVSEKRGVNLKQLSTGFHKISLLIQNREGNWSEAVQKVIEVRS